MHRKKAKTLLGLCIILLSIYAAAIRPPINEALAAQPFPTNRPVLFTYPDIIEKNVGEDFVVSVKIFNLTNNIYTAPDMKTYPLGNLYGFSMKLNWDPTILEFVDLLNKIPIDDYPDGVLWYPTVILPDTEVNATAGFYRLTASSQQPAPLFNNDNQNNTVFDITFRAKKEGACALTLTNVDLAGAEPGDRIYHEGYVVGYGSWGRGAIFTTPGAPVARFSVWPSDLRAGVNKPVTFNASESYDTDGTIADYIWDFGDGGTSTTSNPISEHVYTSTGAKKVTLKVRDNEGVESLRVEKSITVLQKRDIYIQSVEVPIFAVKYGRVAPINATVYNNSTSGTESFQVSAYYNSTPTSGWILIGTKSVVNLTTNTRLNFLWNTSDIVDPPPPSATYYYHILINATYVPHEANTTNNSLRSESSITVPAGDIYDIRATITGAAVEMPGGQAFYSPFILGENATIRFKVSNLGTLDELCNVTLRFVARNGTQLLSPQEWTNIDVGFSGEYAASFSTVNLPATYCNISIQVDTLSADNPADNYDSIEVRVVKPPQIHVTYPQNIYANQSATFDATSSIHQDPDGEIVSYHWQFYQPGATVPSSTLQGSTVDYTFLTSGDASVRLIITDNFGLTFDDAQNRPAADGYASTMEINVQAGAGGASQFPIDPIYIVAGIIIVAIVAIVVIRFLRKPKQSA